MNLERHGDCNIVSKRTAAKERAICMLYLDQVHCNAIYEHLAFVCACVHARVFVLACESVRNCTHACNSVSKNEPTSMKAD